GKFAAADLLGALRHQLAARLGVELEDELAVAQTLQHGMAELHEVGDLDPPLLHLLLVLLVVPLLIDVRMLALETRGPVAAAVPEPRLEQPVPARIEHRSPQL